jgi:AraC family transcriptional regulator of adaptative response/methylated-DNA-[protein]-cysteine methyltransferase
MKKLFLHSFATRIGIIRTAATEKGLALIFLPREPRKSFEIKIERLFSGYEICSGGKVNLQAEKQLAAYLDGRLKKFTLKLDIHASPFQKKVLQRVARIPYGKTMTYGEVARAVGSPRASRAVGSANAHNKLPLVIPCHRVVAATGLGGYGGGLKMKNRLLRLEGAL